MRTHKLWVVRDTFGTVTDASLKGPLPEWIGGSRKVREVSTTKDLVRAMLQTGTSRELFDAAWRKAVADGAVPKAIRLHDEDSPACLVHDAQVHADSIEWYIADLVNNPRSKFYIYG